MKWHEIRERFPSQWLLVEALQAHSEENKRIIEKLTVIDIYPDSNVAMQGYQKLHSESPQRELYVFHTDREKLDIKERRWVGLRGF